MLKILLFPLSAIYRIVISIRNFMYESNIFSQHEFDLPIISVGNITVGGTGKTPHSEYLINLLKNQFNIGYLSRGYKRKTKGYVRATPQSTSREIGDEAMQITQKFPNIPVAVCEKRVKGVAKLLEETNNELDTIILDDAFQHRSIKPHINILLIDYNRPIHQDHLLPAGQLREPIQARFRANIIIVTKCPEQLAPIDQRIMKTELEILPYQNLFFTSISYGNICSAQSPKTIFKADLSEYIVYLFTGIAHAQPLLNYIQPKCKKIIHKKFNDHYAFKTNDIDTILDEFNQIEDQEKILVTTEKDLARIISNKNIKEKLIENLYYIPIIVKFLDGNEEPFNRKILNYVTENKSNSKLHKRQNRF